jgi:hypothetical protein
METLRSAVPEESAVCDRLLERVTGAAVPLTEELKEQLVQSELEVFSSSRQSLDASFSRQADLLQQVNLPSLLCCPSNVPPPSPYTLNRSTKRTSSSLMLARTIL